MNTAGRRMYEREFDINIGLVTQFHRGMRN